MEERVKVYKIKDFIRKTKTGDIDLEESFRLVKEIASFSRTYPDHNILLDLRHTEVVFDNASDTVKIVNEIFNHLPSFDNKIANVVTNNDSRIFYAKIFEACMQLKNYQYKYFTEFEVAIEWLSEINETP